jgi:hypothetical protein
MPLRGGPLTSDTWIRLTSTSSAEETKDVRSNLFLSTLDSVSVECDSVSVECEEKLGGLGSPVEPAAAQNHLRALPPL